jgi:hypothetical protein
MEGRPWHGFTIRLILKTMFPPGALILNENHCLMEAQENQNELARISQ